VTGELSPHALAQQQLWGTDPDGWAAVAEPLTRPVFETLLDATGVGEGNRVLDVGCGSGLALQLAAERGAEVAGIDVSPGLLGVARLRLPDADLRLGDLQELPWAAGRFDTVLAVNALQFAEDPGCALTEVVRVTGSGGSVAVAMFAEPQRCESTAVHLALSALSPPERQAVHQPYSLSPAGNLERAMTTAGLDVTGAREVPVDWAFPSADVAVRGLLSSGGGARALQDNDRDTVETAVRAAVAPFIGGDGRVVMHNVFRVVLGRARGAAG
jgi:SAM-dependent methyltransferase